MAFKMSAVLSGIGKGLESAGTIGMQYLANSRLQADRMAAEEQRMLKLQTQNIASEQKMQTQRLGQEKDLKMQELQLTKDLKATEFSLDRERNKSLQDQVNVAREKLGVDREELAIKKLGVEQEAKYRAGYLKVLGGRVAASERGQDISLTKEQIKGYNNEIKQHMAIIGNPASSQSTVDNSISEVARIRAEMTAAVAEGGAIGGGAPTSSISAEDRARGAKNQSTSRVNSYVDLFKKNPSLLTDPAQMAELEKRVLENDKNFGDYERAKGLYLLEQSQSKKPVMEKAGITGNDASSAVQRNIRGGSFLNNR